MKKSIWFYIVLGAVIAVSAAAVVWSLISFNVIRLPKKYEPVYITLSDDELGSACRLEGKTAYVSVFADDDTHKWDFGSEEFASRRDSILAKIRIALDWVSAQAEKYGKTAEFVCAGSPDDTLLYCEGTVGTEDLTESVYSMYLDCDGGAAWELIEKNIDTDAIRETYSCDNIVYAFFVNSDKTTGAAVPVFDKPHDKPYELYVCGENADEEQLPPSVIAHEMIHLFGAPDLYKSDTWKINYCFTSKAVEYCKENFPTDIMLSTKAPGTEVRLQDRIDNEITPITAYYIGWCDAPIDIDEFRLVNSQFDRKD